MLTAKDVERVRFTAATLRRGYDQREVDELLDRVAATLRQIEEGAGAVPGGVMTPEEIDATLFTTTSPRGGYDEREVDALLERVSQTLRHYGHDAQLLRPADPEAAPRPAHHRSPDEVRAGPLARLVRLLRGE